MSTGITGLARMGTRLAAARTPDEIASVALEEISDLVPASGAGVYLFIRSSLDVYSNDVKQRDIDRYCGLPPGADPLLSYAQRTLAPVHEGMLLTSDGWRRSMVYQVAAAPLGFEHYLVAPLVGHGQLVGALTLARRRQYRSFAEPDLTLMAAASTCASVALAFCGRCEANGLGLVPRMTRRERDIALFVAKGLCNHEIAEQLGVSVDTIKKDLKSLFRRLGASRRAELAWLITVAGMA